MKTYRKLFATVAFLVIAAMALTGTAFAAEGEATVTASALNMRSGGSMDNEIIDVAMNGAKVYVNSDCGNGWYNVSFNGKLGYMFAQYLSFFSSDVPASIPTSDPSCNGTIQGTFVRFRSAPSLNAYVYDYLHTGTGVQVNGYCGDWCEVMYNGILGYVYSTYVRVNGQGGTYTVSAPATVTEPTPVYSEPQQQAQSAPAQQTEPTPAPQQQSAPSGTLTYNAAAASAIIATAKSLEGIPYVWAGTSPEEGFDCSGFVYYVYQQNGYSINRVAQAQYYNGADVPLDQLMPGDILCFGSSTSNIWHVGISLGGDTFIHSPQTGDVVREQSLSDSYGLRLVAARRICY